MSWEDSTPDERQASASRMAYEEMGRANELAGQLDQLRDAVRAARAEYTRLGCAGGSMFRLFSLVPKAAESKDGES